MITAVCWQVWTYCPFECGAVTRILYRDAWHTYPQSTTSKMMSTCTATESSQYFSTSFVAQRLLGVCVLKVSVFWCAKFSVIGPFWINTQVNVLAKENWIVTSCGIHTYLESAKSYIIVTPCWQSCSGIHEGTVLLCDWRMSGFWVKSEHLAPSCVSMSVVRSCSDQVCVMMDGYYHCSKSP